jgi:hypothetical protein
MGQKAQKVQKARKVLERVLLFVGDESYGVTVQTNPPLPWHAD